MGEKITQTLRDAESLVVGAKVGDYKRVLQRDRGPVRRPRRGRTRRADLRPADHGARRHRRRVGAARPAGPAPRRTGRGAPGRRPAARLRTGAGLPLLRRRPGPHRSGLLSANPTPTSTGTASGTRRPSPPRRSSARPRPPTTCTASGTSSSRAESWPGAEEVKAVPRTEGALPRGAHHPRPERRLVAARGRRAVPPSGRHPRLRRGPLRSGGRLLGTRGPRRVPARHRAAHGDQHDRHRLAAADPRPGPAVGLHPARPTRTSGPCRAPYASPSCATRWA